MPYGSWLAGPEPGMVAMPLRPKAGAAWRAMARTENDIALLLGWLRMCLEKCLVVLACELSVTRARGADPRGSYASARGTDDGGRKIEEVARG